MRILSLTELNNISGAARYIEITEKLIIRGISDFCIGSYYEANKDTIEGLPADLLMDEIYQSCPYEITLQFDLYPVSVVLVDL